MAVNRIHKHPARDLGYSLLGPSHLPPGDREMAMRDVQNARPGRWRALKSSEIDQLVQNGNVASDWGSVLVTEKFNPKYVLDCRFYGLVRIGDLEPLVLEFQGLQLPVGLSRSRIVSCDIGDNCVIDRVAYLAHCVLGDEVLLHNIGQLMTTPRARFGHGMIFDDEEAGDRPWIEVGNEAGSRPIAAFEGMRAGDAWLWSKYRGDASLMRRLCELTDRRSGWDPGRYSQLGDRTVIVNARAIVDLRTGGDACIRGANRIENVTVCSDGDEISCIDEGTSLTDGIVGYGCRIGAGVQARRFVLGANVQLDLGARAIHSFVGDNSTIACCEALNNLIFPSHEQHHNNSFLIASTVQGQSNIAAGATIGSNHNSRAADGELLAARGFWPGLCTSFKHPSRFAPFTLIAKGHYPAELNVRLPFSLVANSEHQGCLVIIPAYWFLFNMYAVMRNGWKYRARDARIHDDQKIEYEPLAPDTVESILAAVGLLERWVGQAQLKKQGEMAKERADEELRKIGRDLLENQPRAVDELRVLAEGIESSQRPVRVTKASQAYPIYLEMAHYYAVDAVSSFIESEKIANPEELVERLSPEPRERVWVNLGGQIVGGADLETLKERIRSGELTMWDEVHMACDELWEGYAEAKARHGLSVLTEVSHLNLKDYGPSSWQMVFKQAIQVRRRIDELTRGSRAKDYRLSMRRVTFETAEEMAAVQGRIEDDRFVNFVGEQTEAFERRVLGILDRWSGARAAK